MSWIVNSKRTMHYFIYLYTIHNKMYFISWNKINVRNLTLEYLSGKCIHKNSPLSEQFQNQISKWKKETKSIPLTYKIYIYIYVWKLNQTVLELDFIAVKFCSSLDGIWTHTIVTLQHHSLSLTSSALDHSTTSTPYINVWKSSQRMNLRDVGSETSVNDTVQTNKNDK